MGKPRELRASVVIPTWNAAGFVERVLPALKAQQRVEAEILVVDNGVINDETERVCSRFPGVRYLRFEPQLGYAGAVNEGVRAAGEDLIAVTNNDNIPDPFWLQRLIEAYRAARDRGSEAIVSSLVERSELSAPLASRMNYWGRIVSDSRPGKYQPFHPDGSAFLFSRSAFGLPYDPAYFLYHEDVYLGWRAWLSGAEVLLAEGSRARSFDGGSTRRIPYRTAFFTERNRWQNYLLFLSVPNLLRLLPALLLDAILKLLAGRNRRAKLHAWASLLPLLPGILAQRERFQAQRKRSDREVLALLSDRYVEDGGPAAKLLNGLFRAYFRVTGFPG